MSDAIVKKQGILAGGSLGLFVLLFLRFWKAKKGETTTVTQRFMGRMRRQLLQGTNQHDDHRDSKAEGATSHRETNGSSSVDTEVSRIRENHRLIQAVLSFWFGQHGGPEVSQKKLWMISQQNVELRRTVDTQIATQFGDLLLELSTGQRWNEWCMDVTDMYGYQGKLAAIIVLDQFSRHIHRLFSQQLVDGAVDQRLGLQQKMQAQLPAQSVLDALAYETAVLLTDKHKVELQTGMMSTPMAIFALMPYRHQATVPSVQWTQQKTEQLAVTVVQSDAMIRSFRKATNRRLAVLQDEARRTGGKNSNTDAIIGPVAPSSFTDNDILECFPFSADLSPAKDHIVHRTIRDFLAAQGISDPKGDTSTQIRPIVVSLSGGVDSMVIAGVLAHLKRHCGYRIRTVAVHIDYANRPESEAEAAYVERYCHELAIEFHCRRIDEVTRGITARDDYERIARDIRYTCYRETVSACLNEHLKADQVGVMLGHHRGDLRENVLSNAHKGCGPLDLSGMTATSCNDGVTLYRPLLPLEKTAVFDYAHTFGVPYFKDTTPHWSTRGKLRNKLLPLLEEIYGEGSMNNLSNLAVESDECRALLYNVMIQPFMDRIVYKPMGIVFPTAPWREQGPFFWKFVLREALHSAGLGMFTDKSVESFMKRACDTRVREGWLQCRKDYAVYLRTDGQVFVLYPNSFPWHKKGYYDCTGRTVAYGSENSVRIGLWRVTAELYKGVNSQFHPDEIKSALERKAFTSMESFMEGSYTYYLNVPTKEIGDGEFEPQPLAFTKFVKRSRPRSWKGIDPKIQDTLPLLGNDEEAIKALDDPVGYGSGCMDGDENISANPVLCAKVTLQMTGDSLCP
jgi:tRNA(Ile)-lysidine synthetase-like protein